MLGHDATFGYVAAVKQTHEKNLLAKRLGYLTCNLVLHRDHELMLLLINTMQTDLNSSNHLEVCAALSSVSRLVNLEMVPAIFPLVQKLFAHSQEIVRKKAVMAIHRFIEIAPETLSECRDQVKRALCDPDPSVMAASLHVVHKMAKTTNCKDLVPSLVAVLKQVIEHRLPRDFDYHRMPAPWTQIRILTILRMLGAADQQASEGMYEILMEVLRRADTGVNAGFAVCYQCVRTITGIYPSNSLLEVAAKNISRFISSENMNLKYLGVTGLAEIVQVNPAFAA
jgi:AP-4 complex subunit epsilon-1